MTETKIHHTDSQSFIDVAKKLIEGGFNRDSMSPPSLYLGKITAEELVAKSRTVREVFLTEKYKLIKESSLPTIRQEACTKCGWKALELAAQDKFALYAAHSFSCSGMACLEDIATSLPKYSYFTLVRIDLPKKTKTYDEDKFDFSDWNGIRRSSGF